LIGGESMEEQFKTVVIKSRCNLFMIKVLDYFSIVATPGRLIYLLIEMNPELKVWNMSCLMKLTDYKGISPQIKSGNST
jgi:hypothetical protein